MKPARMRATASRAAARSRRLDPRGRRVLDLVVADAVDTRHEHHRRRRDLREVARVVAGTGHDVTMREAEAAALRTAFTGRVERDRLVIEDLLELGFGSISPAMRATPSRNAASIFASTASSG